MFTVALIGPDGAGKTTVARELQHSLALPAKYLYMGVNWDASDHLLPTTRLIQAVRRSRRRPAGAGGRPDSTALATAAGPFPRRVLRAAWSALSLANRLGEEWYRQLLAWRYVRQGVVVIFDRHFFSDYYAHDVAGNGRSLGRRVHGLLLSRVYPKPNLVIYLDAPPELLLARKGEGTLDSLERRRHDYLDLARHTRHFVAVDASRALGDVVADVANVIESFAAVTGKTPRRSATDERP